MTTLHSGEVARSDLLATITASGLKVSEAITGSRSVFLKVEVHGNIVFPKLKQSARETCAMAFHPSSTVSLSLMRDYGLPDKPPKMLKEYTKPVADILKQTDQGQSIEIMDSSGIFLASINITIVNAGFPDVLHTILEHTDRVEEQKRFTPAILGSEDSARITLKGFEDVGQSLRAITPALGEALQAIQSIMNNMADAHPLLKISWTMLLFLYKAEQHTSAQDEALCDLVDNLRETVALASECPNLKDIEMEGTIDVITTIGALTIDISCFIDKYARSSFSGLLLCC